MPHGKLELLLSGDGEEVREEISLTLAEFIKASKHYNVIPLSIEVISDFVGPVDLYSSLPKRHYSFLLESVEGEEKISRFSFIGFEPLYLFSNRGREITIKDFLQKETSHFITTTDVLKELEKFMRKFRVKGIRGVRFSGGFVGFLGYENIRLFEPVLEKKEIKKKNFDSQLVFTKYLIIFDHLRKTLRFVNFVVMPEKNLSSKNRRKVYERERKNLLQIVSLSKKTRRVMPLYLRKVLPARFASNFSYQEFIKAVKKAKSYIRRGDIIQVVLSQAFRIKFSASPFTVYRYLRFLNPSAYMYFLHFEGLNIIGSSPEMLLRCEKREIVTRPIAGTRPRGRTEEEDRQLASELLQDEKERAEHIMLLDLGRNDLGRVAEKNTVRVSEFMKIERFSAVMHIVSEVRARLAKGKTAFDALRACFPAGTVSGAPKIRAMQIIEELEPQPRGIYAGCIGYFSFSGNIDTAIVIRTIVARKNVAFVQAGAGIVLNSKPRREYYETFHKAKALLKAVSLAEGA